MIVDNYLSNMQDKAIYTNGSKLARVLMVCTGVFIVWTGVLLLIDWALLVIVLLLLFIATGAKLK